MSFVSLAMTVIFLCQFGPVFANAATLDEIRAILEAQTETLKNQQEAIRHLQEQNVALRLLIERQLKKPQEEALTVAAVPDKPEIRQTPDVTPPAPPPAADEWRFSVGPRIAYRSFFPFSPRFSETFQSSLQEVDFITGGVTLTLAPPGWLTSELLLTVLYGDGGHSQWQGLAVGAPVAIRGRTDNKLLDVELLYRRDFQHTNAQWYAGLQYISLDFNVDLGRTVPGLGYRIVQGGNTFLAKVGIGGFFTLSEDGLHRLFSNFLIAPGFLTVQHDVVGDDSAFILAWDANVGYQWVINSRNTLSARYRGQYAHSFGLAKLADGFEILHGPELQYSYRW